MNNFTHDGQIEASVAELEELFKKRDGTQPAGDVLDDVLWTPGVVFKLDKHGADAANLHVVQKGIFSFKNNVLKNWVIGVPQGSDGARKASSSSGVGRPCTITIDPRDIEDARWAGTSKSIYGFIVTATVSDGEGVHRGAAKIIAMPESVANKANLPVKNRVFVDLTNGAEG